ncbi:hypothetical protein QBC45DRAFT_397740 [Copromyces sp. CBS 386.78]|nr:hypothetical protein QBC45DRAFT_397740 [Copromyces sp. CBS 386.78]
MGFHLGYYASYQPYALPTSKCPPPPPPPPPPSSSSSSSSPPPPTPPRPLRPGGDDAWWLDHLEFFEQYYDGLYE